jgi:eukaryotic-like serine/threonine-protein kinase
MKRCTRCGTSYPNQNSYCEIDGAMLTASAELDPGTIIRDKYRIVRALGQGGMGTVYLADHILLGRQRALKFISTGLNQDPRLLKRFRLEALAAIELRHPNIVEVVDLDQAEDGSPYIAMEYVAGPELRHVLEEGPLAVERSLEIARGIAAGLSAAHARGIIHRDVKPENILLARQGEQETPKLLDFGIAAIREDPGINMTRTRGLMLTQEYAAPEQWLGMPAERMDGRVDLYALGGVLYEMLTGQGCLSSVDNESWGYWHTRGERRPPGRLRPELAQWPGLDALVVRLLCAEREGRPSSALDVVRDLDVLMKGRSAIPSEAVRPAASQGTTSVAARAEPKADHGGPSDVPVRGRARRKGRATRWTLIAAASLIVAVAAFLGTSLYRKKQTTSGPALTAGDLRQNPKDGLEYAWIPGGQFLMGCSSGDTRCADDEKPAHKVTLTSGFWIGQTPVTVAGWIRYRAATSAPGLLTSDLLGRTNLNEAGPDNMPVVFVSWDQAQTYCRWDEMNLPTEAQWEYAARAGSSTPLYGDLNNIAWYADNSGRRTIDATELRKAAGNDHAQYERQLFANGDFAHPVGQKQPNAWNLYDMLGNVSEWTADWYGADTYRSGTDRDPTGPATGQMRVIRGGSWANLPTDIRVSARTKTEPDARYSALGFRCAGNF